MLLPATRCVICGRIVAMVTDPEIASTIPDKHVGTANAADRLAIWPMKWRRRKRQCNRRCASCESLKACSNAEDLEADTVIRLVRLWPEDASPHPHRWRTRP